MYIVHDVWSVSMVVVVLVVVVMVCQNLWPTSVPSMTACRTCHFRVASTAPDTARYSHRGISIVTVSDDGCVTRPGSTVQQQDREHS